jgi:hypothetical protein
MQNLGNTGLHPCPLAGRQDYHVRVRHLYR